MLMSVQEDWLDAVITVLILLGVFFVLVWMDLSYYQTIGLVLVKIIYIIYSYCPYRMLNGYM